MDGKLSFGPIIRKKKQTMKNTIKNHLTTAVAALALGCLSPNVFAGTITIIGNGAGSGPIFVTDGLGNIDLGTRLRIGTFTDVSSLNAVISAFQAGTSDYNTALTSLNSNFVDLGTNVANYGNTSQSSSLVTVSSSQFQFQNTVALTINGVTGNWNVFNGSIQNVNYTSGIGTGKNLYAWVAFNNQIGIVRNADGTGTADWKTPTSDLSGVTMNLSSLSSSEVLLGNYVNYATGSDLISLQAAVPEPSSAALVVLGLSSILAMRQRKQLRKS